MNDKILSNRGISLGLFLTPVTHPKNNKGKLKHLTTASSRRRTSSLLFIVSSLAARLMHDVIRDEERNK
jgi:hypothetical protein